MDDYRNERHPTRQEPANDEELRKAARRRSNIIAFSFIGVVVALALLASLFGRQDGSYTTSPTSSGDRNATAPLPQATPEPRRSAPVAPPPPEMRLGEEVRDGSFAFVVQSVEGGIASVGTNPYLSRNAQGHFVVVQMSVTNISDRPKTFFNSNQKLYDAAGREFSNDSSAEMNFDTSALLANINPGNSIITVAVFDLPLDAVPTKIKLHDSMFSRGTVVNLL